MNAGSLQEEILALWGSSLTRDFGVLHVTAVGRAPEGGLAVLRIGPGSPPSGTDFFALSVARARADAIITTGSILRSESEVDHDPGPELRAWRREVLGKENPPKVVILTRGKDLPLEHPALQNPDVIIATDRSRAGDIEPVLHQRGIEVPSLTEASLRCLCTELRDRDMGTVCVETGPSTSTSLYSEPMMVDELMLSVFEEETLSETQVAGRFLDEAVLEQRFGAPRQEVRRSEKSGSWRFLRFVAANATEALATTRGEEF